MHVTDCRKKHMGAYVMTGVDFLNFLPYFAGYDGETWNNSDGQQIPFEVTHWMKLPDIPKGEPGDYL